MTMEPNETSTPQGKLGAAGSWLLRNILSLLTAIVLGVGLGAGIFYGGQSLLGIPAAPAAESISQPQRDLTALEEQIVILEDDQADLEQRVASLERENAAQQDALLTLLDNAAVADEAAPDQTVPDGDLSSIMEEIAVLTDRIGALEQRQGSEGVALQESSEQWAFVRAMMLLLRARISLLDADYGQAQDDVELARTTLLPYAELTDMDIIISRLDRVLDEIAETPGIAADDLNIAWDLLARFSEEYTPAQVD